MNDLAFWTNCDQARMIRLFLASALGQNQGPAKGLSPSNGRQGNQGYL